MCGIVGYVGKEQAAPILLDGLSKLEYRGYDSAGIAVRDNASAIKIVKAKGRLKGLIEKTDAGHAVFGTCGIGHTRWATHGEPSETNAHPHTSDDGNVVGVHNGIIENYQELKAKMTQRSAIVETLNFAFPTIITSGAIMSICGFLIGSMTSEPVIAGIGESLGRGTVISIIMVMFALPQILLIGSRVIDKTSFSVPSVVAKKNSRGRMTVNGMVYGHINGTVRGMIHATVEGDVDLTMLSGAEGEEVPDDEEED